MKAAVIQQISQKYFLQILLKCGLNIHLHILDIAVWFPDVIFDWGTGLRGSAKSTNRFSGAQYPQTNAVELTQGTRLWISVVALWRRSCYFVLILQLCDDVEERNCVNKCFGRKDSGDFLGHRRLRPPWKKCQPRDRWSDHGHNAPCL